MRMSVSGWSKVAMAVGALSLGIGVVPARADASDQARLLTLTNQVRSSKGLPALSIDGQLNSVAQSWAATLAQRGVISHNSSLPDQVTGWTTLGENVGVGGSVDAVHQGFMGSPTHLENLVDPSYNRVGFGIVRPDARIFIVQVFMQSASSTGRPATATSSAAATAPASSPAPSVVTTVVTTVKPVAPQAPGPVPAGVQATAGAPAPADQLSPWLVYSLDRLRSMEPVKAK